jgi:membrane glycosyltransferase
MASRKWKTLKSKLAGSRFEAGILLLLCLCYLALAAAFTMAMMRFLALTD